MYIKTGDPTFSCLGTLVILFTELYCEEKLKDETV